MTTYTHETKTPNAPIAADRTIALVFAIVATLGIPPGLVGLLMSGGIVARGLDFLFGEPPSFENLVIWSLAALSAMLFVAGFTLLPRYYMWWRRWTPWDSSGWLWPATIVVNVLATIMCAALTVRGEPVVSALIGVWGCVLVTLATIAMRTERSRLATYHMR